VSQTLQQIMLLIFKKFGDAQNSYHK